MLKNKKIVIGITGGIACYKVCEKIGRASCRERV